METQTFDQNKGTEIHVNNIFFFEDVQSFEELYHIEHKEFWSQGFYEWLVL